ncbi:putative cytochrome P450 6g2 [Pseudolycoriella hygida]|uniref:Cytochrome P450 6g2 n=1 Tax=Pseudolycoriella hygida TaxID=35572 RepID=A0A9Q0MX75_9DIPT|nr:putative cytochrome P450 6g2 [Pseudolycoriella hygida]
MLQLMLVGVFCGLLSLVYYWAYQRQNYWKIHNIPHVKSPLLVGHFFKMVLLKESNVDVLSKLYYHPNAKGKAFVGINIFHKPAILIREPELVKRVLIKDFQYFTNRHVGADPVHDPMSGLNLFQIKNPQWKDLRMKLSPIFTSGKMKQMFYMVENVGNVLNETVANLVKSGKPVVEIRTLFARYTIDSISIVAFGTDSGCLKDPDTSEFLKEAKNAFQVRYFDKVAGHLVFFCAELMKMFNMKTFNPSFEKFLRRLFDEVMTSRMKNGGNRNDLIDALIALKKAEMGKENILSKEILVAQASVFFFAGFETSSSTLEFFFYLLAKHPEFQANVRNEVREALRKHGKICYELISNDLPYLTAGIKETLRLYPILPFLDRVCVLPAHQKGYSLEPFSTFKIPKGMPVYIPIYSMQRDPEYFTDPEKFIPERFMSETNDILWLPFGTGPRNCIGERFAMMQMKVAMVSLLTSFRLEFTPETPNDIELETAAVLLHSDKGILLKFVSDPQ